MRTRWTPERFGKKRKSRHFSACCLYWWCLTHSFRAGFTKNLHSFANNKKDLFIDNEIRMKFILILMTIFSLSSCSKNNMEEINLLKYFQGINGTAVFYNPSVSKYKIYNIPLSHIYPLPPVNNIFIVSP